MEFDVINLTQTEINQLSVVQMKMLRTAQQKKNELEHKAEAELEMFRTMTIGTNTYFSSLATQKEAALQNEVNYQVAIIADNLIYNMSLNEPTVDGDLGDEGGDESAGYIVDYSLSYNQRYVIVRDFYLAIPNADERMSLYRNDATARQYLASYYTTLYNVLMTYST